MADLFASGRIAEILLAIVALEAVLVLAFRQKLVAHFVLRGFFVNLASGVFLMLALRGALTGANWMTIAPWLVASLAAHLGDVWLRWRGQDRSK